MTTDAILTITLNPALDVTTATSRLEIQQKLRCEMPEVTPGGGGANVSRMIARLGGESDAFVALGGPTGKRWQELAVSERLRLLVHDGPGDTRESFQVMIEESGDFYRFILPGPQWSRKAAERLEEAVDNLLLPRKYRWMVISGSLPNGLASDLPARIARTAAAVGVSVIADCSGPALPYLMEAPLSVLRLNRHDLGEAGTMLGLPDAAPDTIARTIIGKGEVAAVLYSLGAAGTTLVQAEGAKSFIPPEIAVSSLTGAGDSLTGALVHALAQGWRLEHAVRLGVAAAAATAMQPGSRLGEPSDIDRIMAGVREGQSPPR